MPSWLMQKPKRWAHLRQVRLRQLAAMLAAVFLLFSTIGPYVDLMHSGVLPYVVVLANAMVGGLNAVAWILVLARAPMYGVLCLMLLQIVSWNANRDLSLWIERTFSPAAVPAQTGIHFAASMTLIAVMLSYSFFVVYIRIVGREAFRLRAELELAHSIQKTLVPIVIRKTPCFEIFGISEPSEKVGGDLVDVVELDSGDTVAYLADIAGHGLQAGILMGMLKTAARTALLDREDVRSQEGGATLSMLMERLNRVLPGVKEPHMYATFTALRLNADGKSFYGMAASPPLLLWSAIRRSIRRIEEEQFPLGLLPVSGFASAGLAMQPGDVVVVATDGILEVCAREPSGGLGAEYGVNAVEKLMMANWEAPLPRLAASILESVRAYGKQVDDQTLLLVRRIASSEPA